MGFFEELKQRQIDSEIVWPLRILDEFNKYLVQWPLFKFFEASGLLKNSNWNSNKTDDFSFYADVRIF